MPDHQPPLPFGEDSTLEEIRRLLETQNDLLRTLVDRLVPQDDAVWTIEALQTTLGSAGLYEDLGDEDLDDEDIWNPFDEDSYVNSLSEPPAWLAQYFDVT